MPSRSAVTWAACQRALSWGSAFAAARNAASFGLRSLGAWMFIAATDSRRGSSGISGQVQQFVEGGVEMAGERVGVRHGGRVGGDAEAGVAGHGDDADRESVVGAERDG